MCSAQPVILMYIHTFEVLMMGGGTAWNMWSISQK